MDLVPGEMPVLLSVSESLRDYLLAEVPGGDGDWIEIQQVHSDDGNNLPQNRLVLCLYHVEVNPHLRNQPLQLTDDGYMRSPLFLTLRYLVAYISNDPEEVQRRLAGVVAAFHRRPRLGPSFLASELVDRVAELRVRMRSMSSEELNQIWTAFNRGMRLALYYDVDVAPVEAGATAAAPPVSRREVHYVGGGR